MKIINNKDDSELIILDDCDFNEFYQFAYYLKDKLGISFIETVDGFDELYYLFKYESIKFILYYSVFSGISIYPKNTKSAGEIEKNLLHTIGEIITST